MAEKALDFVITVLALLAALALSKKAADFLARKGVRITAGDTAAVRG